MYDNLDWTEGAANAPGIGPVVYYARKADIATLPKPTATPATPEDVVTISEAIVMVATKTFKKLRIDELKSPVTCEGQGEMYNRTFLNKASFVSPVATAKAAGAGTTMNNDDIVWLVQDKDENWRLLGNNVWSTSTKVTEKLGDSPTSEKSMNYEVEVTDKVMAPYYTGPIETDDGTINPAV